MVEQVRNATLAVSTTALRVSNNYTGLGTKRSVIVLTNTGATNLTLSWGRQAVAGEGIILYPTGAWSESIDSAYIPSPLDIWVISSAAGGTLGIHERLI